LSAAAPAAASAVSRASSVAVTTGPVSVVHGAPVYGPAPHPGPRIDEVD
jgi:hypothetical protein